MPKPNPNLKHHVARLRLQVNQRGSWGTMLHFSSTDNLADIKRTAVELVDLTDSDARLRIVDEEDRRLDHWTRSDGWHTESEVG